MRPVKDRKALDLGCGTGEASLVLANMGYKVTGVDFSKEALKEVPKRIETINYDLEKINELDFKKESYDIILDSKVLAFIRNKNRYLKTVSTVLKGSGKFIIQGFLKSPKKTYLSENKGSEAYRKIF